VMEASQAYMPLGSGIGSFIPVYASVEPIDTMSRAFWNHAHNDFAEVWLEAGIPALVGLGAFFAWWLISVFSVWRSAATGNVNVAQAATVVTALLLVHSLVDYPLRTLALACVFALCCGLMESWRTRDPD
jgi:O-antigen ligase